MNTNILDSFDPISIVCFLSTFKVLRDTSGFQEGAAMWFLHFMKKQASDSLKSRIMLMSKLYKLRKDGALTTCDKLVNYLLDIYAIDDVIAEMDPEILCFT